MNVSDLQGDDRLTLRRIQLAIEVQFRVLNGLILREAKTRYGRHKLGFFWMFFEPMLLVGLFLAFKLLIQSNTSGGMSDVYFIITGICPFLLFNRTMTGLAGSIISGRTLLAFPQITTFDIVLSTALLELSTLMMVFAAMVLGASVLIEPISIENPLAVLYGTLLLGISGTGIGLIFAALVPILPAVKNVAMPLLGRPLFFTSGIFFSVDMLPESVRGYLLINPLLHMMEIIRSGFFYQFESRYADWHYASLFAAGVFLLGLLMHQLLKDQVIKLA